jgi:hypothetical protein
VRVLWHNKAKRGRIQLAWIPGHAGRPGNEAADRLAAKTTMPESTGKCPPWLNGKFKSVVGGSLKQAQQRARPSTQWTTGRNLREVDSALPGKHVRLLYNPLKRIEAYALAQLRTGHTRLWGFLAGSD